MKEIDSSKTLRSIHYYLMLLFWENLSSLYAGKAGRILLSTTLVLRREPPHKRSQRCTCCEGRGTLDRTNQLSLWTNVSLRTIWKLKEVDKHKLDRSTSAIPLLLVEQICPSSSPLGSGSAHSPQSCSSLRSTSQPNILDR